MQRWNDKLRPIQFTEIDKQSHKLIYSYFLGVIEEEKQAINWQYIIKGSLYEFLQRLTITDIKPTIFSKIKKDKKKYDDLNKWIVKQLVPSCSPIIENFEADFLSFFSQEEISTEQRILSASHILASKWEFDIIEKANPNGYDIDFIKEWFENNFEQFYDLEGIRQLALYKSYRKFVDLCGQLRFQLRWSNLHRFPKTSVLGHSLCVAFTSYLFSKQINACDKRIYNNFFTGLFHDLPEVLTRDIISPVKNSIEGLSDIIKDCEIEQMESIVYPLISNQKKLTSDIKRFTENEFETTIILNNKLKKTTPTDITKEYNTDAYSPRDGQLIKSADEFNAFIEAYSAIINGSDAEEFKNAYKNIKNKYIEIEKIDTIDFIKLYEDFNL